MQRVGASFKSVMGLRRSRRRTISDRATVIPPPVKGWRILNASPNRSAPGVGRGLAGMLLFGMVLMFPLSTAAINAS